MSDEQYEVCSKFMISIIGLFLGPAIFMWIWNWQFSDWYVFEYWPVFWLSLALSSLIRS